MTSGRRVLGAALVAVGLAGCADGGSLTGVPPVPLEATPQPGDVTAHFVSGQDIDVIEVRSLDRLPLRGAVLVQPDGTRTPAYSTEIEDAPQTTSFGGVNGPPDAGGITSLAFLGRGQPQSTTTFIGQSASVALIRPAEPAAYRQVWKDSHLEIQLGEGVDSRSFEIPAPPPL